MDRITPPKALITPPDVPGALPRPDLDKWLEGQSRVCLVGPAGTGKTWLAARHAARLKRSGTTVVWLGLDRTWTTDRNTVRLLIQAALTEAFPEATDPLATLAAPPTPVALFIDNLECLHDPDTTLEIEHLCRQCPADGILWMVGRPPVPASRWLLAFRLQLVGGVRLWWNDQALAPLWANRDDRLSDAARQQLSSRLGGWIGPVTLYLNASEAGGATADLVVQQYVEEEVLRHWTPPIRHVARRMARLPEWAPGLAVPEGSPLAPFREAAMRHLAPFQVNGAFGHQLHPLLSQCLLAQPTDPEEDDAQWQQSMAERYADHPDPLIGCEWLARNQLWADLKDRLAETGHALLRQGYHLQVLGFLDLMPEPMRHEPEMTRLHLWSLFYADRRTDLSRAIRHARAHRHADGLPEDELTLLEMMTRPPRELGTGPEALETLARMRKRAVPVRSVAYLGLASAYYWQGELGEAETLAQEAFTHAKLEQRFSTALSASGLALWLMSIRGEVIRARNLLRDSTLWLEGFHESGHAPNLVSCWRNSARIRLSLLQGDPDGAWKALQPLKLFMASAEPAHQAMTLYGDASWLLHTGQATDALERLNEAEQVIRRAQERFSVPAPPVTALRVRCLLMLGRLRDAGDLIRQTRMTDTAHPLDAIEWQEARCLWALFDGQRDLASEAAEALANRARAMRFLTHHLTARLVQACLTEEKAKRSARFEKCVEMAASNDLMYPLTLFRPFFATELEILRTSPLLGEFVERLCQLNEKPARDAESPVNVSDHDTLSRRELEVLQLIAEGLSNKEIAARLHLAPATVKAHIRNIYSKIGARSRADALRLADALNLL